MRLFTALLAATLPLAAQGAAQLLPFGEFAARDGRPGPGKTWKIDDTRGRQVAAALNAIAARTPIVIDYEHQTLYAATSGKPAPAAGWIRQVEWRDGAGLFSTVDWTAAAKAHIDAREYLYISPVITYDDAGNVTGVALAALTNFPAITGMDAVVAALSTRLNQPETDPMDLLTALCTLLALAPNTTPEVAMAALKTRLDELAAPKPLPAALATALGIKPDAGEAAALSAVASLRQADTGTLQVVTQLQGQVAALTMQLNEGSLVALVDGAIAAHKFAPAHRDWLLGQGRKDMAALKAAIDAAPVIPGLSGQSGEQQQQLGAGGAAALTASQTLVAKQLGLDPKAYAEHLKAAA